MAPILGQGLDPLGLGEAQPRKAWVLTLIPLPPLNSWGQPGQDLLQGCNLLYFVPGYFPRNLEAPWVVQKEGKPVEVRLLLAETLASCCPFRGYIPC